MMTKLPTVCSLTPGVPLRLYLATDNKEIGALIAQEGDDSIERRIYYVSYALKIAEAKNPRAECACLALAYVAQRIQHYFLTHTIHHMKKSHPIRTLLRRPILSGRLAKWLLQLFEYEIISTTPKTVKSQTIADLLA